MRKVIITGASGQLGNCILRRFAGDTDIEWVGLSRVELDVRDAAAVERVLEAEIPFAVINTAAFTGVDDAEGEAEKAEAVNVDGVRVLAEACARRGVALVHISTDYVFSGANGGTELRPYRADDKISPLGVYGSTKARGEKEVAKAFEGSKANYFVVRTGWLYDNEGHNFFNTMRRLGDEKGRDISVVNDQKGTPTWAGSLANSLRALVLKCYELDSGVRHYSDSGVVSWHEFAKEIFRELELTPVLKAVGSSGYPTLAPRPENSHLEGKSFSEELNLPLIDWKDSLKACVNEMLLWESVVERALVHTEEPYDQDTRTTVSNWLEECNRHELIEAFYKDQEFGTGGMRGICGPGTNRINNATIAAATQGLSNYLIANSSDLPSPLKVAIAFDSRHHSPELARVTAEVLAGNGIEALLYTELRPTPQLSFTVRHLGCAAGVVITASHNPPEYNGYKVYYSDGGQIVEPHDAGIISEVRKVNSLSEVKFERSGSLITELGPELDEAYRSKVLTLRQSTSLTQSGSDVCIVFTGLHGTGSVSVPQALENFGFRNVYEVASQAIIDGNFSTVSSPNPEEGQALEAAISLAESVGADLVMGTDPDADRVGLAVPSSDGSYTLFNGNETGALLFDYVLRNGRKDGKGFDSGDFVASTVVTSPLLESIGRGYGVGHRETLTGFKFIAATISDEEGKREFVVGAEESYGYLVGDTARDKDAVSACCLLAELTHELKENNMSLLERLEEIHSRFGVHEDGLVSVVKQGRNGIQEIADLMTYYRKSAPEEILGERVTETRDFLKGVEGFRKSNVLQFITEAGSRITVRPSGTEPKIKYYVSVKSVLEEGADYSKKRAELQQKVRDLFVAFGA